MKLSTKGRYGLRAFIDIAVHCEEEPVSLASVAMRQNISISYLEQLMTKLRKANLIESVRGANGGYILKKSAGSISVGDVLRALEGELMPVECAALDNSEGQQHCAVESCCSTKIVWKKINDSLNETVNNIYIDELVKESKKGQKEGL